MKKVAKYLITAALCMTAFSAVNAADFDGHWAEKYIENAMSEGIVTRSENFRPDAAITRAEFVTMIVRDRKLAYGAYPTSFYDVNENDWYFEYITAAENKGIVQGDESYNFNPEKNITRQDAAVMLGRAYGVPAQVGFNLTKYRDGIYISQYALGYMTYMTNYGIIGGFEDGTVRPVENITRAQAAAMIERIKNPVQNEAQTEEKVEKISFKKGYPSLNDTGVSGGFNLSFKVDTECDIYYSVTDAGQKLSEEEITSFLGHLYADTATDKFIAYDKSDVDIHIIAKSADGKKSNITVIRNAAPLCFERGSGTQRDPYIIKNEMQLEAISRYPKKFFALGNDIELSADFMPIGSAYVKDEMFSGGFDGRGHTISNLDIETNDKFVGLFSYLDGATVKNLYVSAKTVSGANDVGIITGENNGGIIENCFVTGVVKANNNNAGGIVGTNNGKLINCASAAAVVESSMYAGGITGINFGIVENCGAYSHTVTAQMYAGGIAASNSGGTVKNCLAANMNIETVISANSGRIATNLAGGVTENNYCYDKTNAFVTNGYNEGSAQNGTDASWDEITDNTFYIKQLGWNMQDVWEYANGNDILLLPTPLAMGGGYTIGGLTEFTPIKLGSEEELLSMHDNPHMHYILTDNITLTMPWNTVCADMNSEDGGFSGSFNGNGYVIENLVQEYNENIGLYGFIGLLDGGTIRNIKIRNAQLDGGHYTGAVCAINLGNISGAEVTGTITAHDSSSVISVGGVCAVNYANIENVSVDIQINCFANSITAGGICGHNEGRIVYANTAGAMITRGMKVVSNCSVGGVVGYNASGEVNSVFSNAKIIAMADTAYIGGVCGMLDTGEIYKGSAIADMDVTAAGSNDSKAYIGGISGLSNAGTIVHSLTSGKLEGQHKKSYIGGITGYNVSSLVQNTYSTAQLSQDGTESYAGGIAGYNESGYVMYNAALNVFVRSEGNAARVCGINDSGVVETNFAAKEMLINYQQTSDGELDGTGLSVSAMKSEFFFKPVYEEGFLGWSSVKYDGAANGVWTGALANGGYYNLPLLNNVPNQHMFTMPVYEVKIK